MEKTNVVERKKLKENEKTIVYFFVYSLLGWILETVFCIVTLGYFMKRGFLYGPLCPMYGFAAVIMISLLKGIKTNTIGKFCICMITFTLFEYIVAVVLESLFGLKWWDYSNEAFNFQGRISLPYSIAWGIIGVIFVEKIHPFIVKKVEKISEEVNVRIQLVFIYFLITTIFIDFILSIIKYVSVWH